MVIALLFLLYFGQLALTIDHYVFDSDDLSQQTMLALRGKYGTPAFWSSPDNYYLKYPLYQIAQRLFGMTYKALAFEVIASNIVLFASLIAAYWLLIRSKVLARAPLWLIGLISFWTISVANPNLGFIYPNSRNAELGIAILIMVILGLLYTRQLGAKLSAISRLALTACLGVITGALFFDDPYFLYVIGGTIGVVALLLLLRVRSRRQVIDEGQYLSWIFLFVSAVVYVAVGRIALHYGLHVYTSSALGVTFASFQTIGASIQNTVGGILAVYNGMFFGDQIDKLGSYRLLLNALLASILLSIGFGQLRKGRQLGTKGIRLLLPLAALVMMGSYLFSANSSDGLVNSRYLIIFLPVFLILIPTAIMELKKTETNRIIVRFVVAALLISALWNSASYVKQMRSAGSHSSLVATQFAIVDAIGKLGLHKGYADYWDADTTTFISKGDAVTISVSCNDSKLSVSYWLMDSAWLQKPASRSYLVQDPTYASFQRCTSADLARQFGPPAQSVPATASIRVLVYNYDITTKFPPRTTYAAP